MKLTTEQIDWLNRMVNGTWQLNGCGLIDVEGNVNCSYELLTHIPFRFGYVSGQFRCHHNNLISLSGAPKKVGGSFYCNYNKLTSLSDGPKEVGGDFYCYSNKLISFFEFPTKIGGEFVPDFDKKFDFTDEFALSWVTKSEKALEQINNPSDKLIQLHNMLWKI